MLGIVVLAAGVGLVAATPVMAHTSLAQANPGIGVEVTQVTEILLQFADDLSAEGPHAIRLMTPDERTVVAEGDAELRDRRTIALPVDAELPGNGQYLVDWMIVAEDGDEQRSRYAFTYTGAATDFVDGPGEPDPVRASEARPTGPLIVGGATLGLLLVLFGGWAVKSASKR